MKKLLALVLVAVMMFAFIGCEEAGKGNNQGNAGGEVVTGGEVVVDKDTDLSGIKFGLICLHDENSTYDRNFIEAFLAAKDELGLTDDQVVIKRNVDEIFKRISQHYDIAKLYEKWCELERQKYKAYLGRDKFGSNILVEFDSGQSKRKPYRYDMAGT